MKDVDEIICTSEQEAGRELIRLLRDVDVVEIHFELRVPPALSERAVRRSDTIAIRFQRLDSTGESDENEGS